MVVNLVRSGRKQPQLFSASAGGPARHPSTVRLSRRACGSRVARVALHALLACTAVTARALGGVAFELGSGDGVKTGRAALQRDWNSRWLQSANWRVGGYWDVALGYWNWNNTAPGLHEELFDFGLTPVLRLQPNGLAGPYVEAGIGLHLLSHSSIGERRMVRRSSSAVMSAWATVSVPDAAARWATGFSIFRTQTSRSPTRA